MANMKYLLNCRKFISLMVYFLFFDNFGMKEYDFEMETNFFKMKKYNYTFKVKFVGEAGVGKTQIINKFVENKFLENYEPTIGVDFTSKIVDFGNKKIELQLWDASGQKKFKDITRTYYKNSDLIVLVYAINNRTSFESISSWVNDVINQTDKNTKFLLVGNKCDLKNDGSVPTDEAKKYAEKNSMEFIEVSAKTGKGIDDMFNYIITELLKDMEKEENKFIENTKKENIKIDNHKINDSQDDNNSQKKNHNNDLFFWNKYCSCCPCL